MADAQASGACYGNIVWVQVRVQVPSSALKREQKCSLFLCFILLAMHKLSLYSLNIKEKAAAYATAFISWNRRGSNP